MTSSDLELLSKICKDTKRRAVSMRQLSFFFHTPYILRPVRGVPLVILSSRLVLKNWNGGATWRL